MQKNKDQNQEVRKLLAFKFFEEGRTDILAYRGAICKLNAKHKVLTQEARKL